MIFPARFRRCPWLAGLLLVLTVALGFQTTRLSAAEAAGAASNSPSPANTSPSLPLPKRALIYTLSPGDKVRVAVFQEEDLSALTRVDGRGAINLPLIGDLRVIGLTLNDAQRVVEQGYKDGRILREPKVTISVEEYARREISVLGEVRAPGKYDLPIESSLTLVEAITRAGGFTDIARGTEVRITRIDGEGKETNLTVDVQSIIRGLGKSKAEDNSLLLQPNDIVFVPQRII